MYSAAAYVQKVTARNYCECGALGVGFWNYADHKAINLLEVTGTKGMLRTAVASRSPIELETGDGVETFESAEPHHVKPPLIQSIVDPLRGRGTCPSTGGAAASTSKVIDCLLHNYYGGREDAFWQRPESWPGRRQHE